MQEARPQFDENEVLRLDNQLCFPLWAAAKAVVHRYTPFLDELGITYTQYIVLMALWEQDQLSVKALGNKVFLDSGTITPLLKKLEAKGLITRTRSEHDERSITVGLTEAGRELKNRAIQVPLRMAGCIDLSLEEGMQLVQLLHKVMHGIEASGEGTA